MHVSFVVVAQCLTVWDKGLQLPVEIVQACCDTKTIDFFGWRHSEKHTGRGSGQALLQELLLILYIQAQMRIPSQPSNIISVSLHQIYTVQCTSIYCFFPYKRKTSKIISLIKRFGLGVFVSLSNVCAQSRSG